MASVPVGTLGFEYNIYNTISFIVEVCAEPSQSQSSVDSSKSPSLVNRGQPQSSSKQLQGESSRHMLCL